jgi:hypothetical protein
VEPARQRRSGTSSKWQALATSLTPFAADKLSKLRELQPRDRYR